MTTDFVLLLEQVLGIAVLGFGLGLIARYLRVITDQL